MKLFSLFWRLGLGSDCQIKELEEFLACAENIFLYIHGLDVLEVIGIQLSVGNFGPVKLFSVCALPGREFGEVDFELFLI